MESLSDRIKAAAIEYVSLSAVEWPTKEDLGLNVHLSRVGSISPTHRVWVAFSDSYMYQGDTVAELLKDMETNWRRDSHLFM